MREQLIDKLSNIAPKEERNADSVKEIGVAGCLYMKQDLWRMIK
ncbi:hypothetical protein [Anaerocolumna sp. MB42-C2]|nr:hypothetical protein [Anaerocolumna sp. MB42-C2]WMJ90185.1 hypothetical protein RBU59_11860 [Anaerocolumna sp. MB42-C2]